MTLLALVIAWFVLSAALVVIVAALCASGRHEDHLLGYQDRRVWQTPLAHPLRRANDRT